MKITRDKRETDGKSSAAQRTKAMVRGVKENNDHFARILQRGHSEGGKNEEEETREGRGIVKRTVQAQGMEKTQKGRDSEAGTPVVTTVMTEGSRDGIRSRSRLRHVPRLPDYPRLITRHPDARAFRMEYARSKP